ncbi:hypothetical protein [Nocardia harenae]|uniref:hypothetical protein n=1 Tax=Nocardia harenae TaxID=358707 RepID=UPI000A9537D5|nr:hypothetical protein [Nocardia harenae]
MGVIGEMFPGGKLQDESGQSGDGQSHRPAVELDLDSGVVRLTTPRRDEDGESAAE